MSINILQLILLQAALFALQTLFEEEYAPRPIFVSIYYLIFYIYLSLICELVEMAVD